MTAYPHYVGRLAVHQAPSVTDYDDVNPFPPAWVKTTADFEAWDRGEIQKALDDHRPLLDNDEAWALMDKFWDDLMRERESHALAEA